MSVALVTGATAGIGREFAEQLAARGHALVLVARDVERLEAAAVELRQRHRVTVEVLPADLSDRAQVQRVADRVAATGPDPRPVDVLVNNAGYGLGTPFVETSVEEEERLLDVLVRAVLVLSHTAARAMTERGQGQIINVSSVAGFITSGSYSAAKSYVTVLTEALSAQLRGTGVTATALCPGFVVTEFHERAGIEQGERTGPFWLDAADLVRTALADADRGRAVSIPSPQYKALVTALRHLPRALVRNPRVRAVHRRQRRDPFVD